MKITTLIAEKKKALKAARPKSRDRIRHRLKCLLVAQHIRKGRRVA